MADDLEQARQDARDMSGCASMSTMDAALDRLEEAVRASERAAVVKLIREHPWSRTADWDTVDAVADLILGGTDV